MTQQPCALDGAEPIDWEQYAANYRHENLRLRAALMDLMNEFPTRADAMAKAAQLLHSH